MIMNLKKETYDKMMKLQLINFRKTAEPKESKWKKEVTDMKGAFDEMVTKTMWNEQKSHLIGMITQLKKEIYEKVVSSQMIRMAKSPSALNKNPFELTEYSSDSSSDKSFKKYKKSKKARKY